MANDERAKKLLYALDFYKQAEVIFSMRKEYYTGFYHTYGFNIDEDWNKSKLKKEDFDFDVDELIEGRKRELLIELGKVGEYVLKYIILLKQIEDFPNQSHEEFNNKPLFNMSVKAIKNAYVNQYGLSNRVVDNVKDLQDSYSFQPLHNFDYLFNVIKKMYPSIANDIYKSLELTIKDDFIKDSNLPDIVKQYYLFGYHNYNGIDYDKNFNQYKDDFDRIMSESGDVFSRLRYLANNPLNKQYSLKDVTELMRQLLAYAKIVHETNHDNVNKDVKISNIKKNYLEYKKEIIKNKEYSKDKGSLRDYVRRRMAEEEKRFDELASISSIMKDYNLFLISLESSLPVKTIKELADSGYTTPLLSFLVANNITPEIIKLFNEKGVGNITNIYRILKNSRLSIDALKDIDNDHFPLLVWLDIDTIEHIKENKFLDNYIVNNRGILKNFFKNNHPKGEDNMLFNKIIQLGEINEDPDIIRLLDYHQFNVLDKLYINRPSDKEVLKNIEENIRLFKGTPLFEVVPLMLDPNNTMRVYELIKKNGFNDKKPTKMSSTIFCIPYDIVASTVEKLNRDNSKLIIDNSVNARFLFEVEKERNDLSFSEKGIKRH